MAKYRRLTSWLLVVALPMYALAPGCVETGGKERSGHSVLSSRMESKLNDLRAASDESAKDQAAAVAGLQATAREVVDKTTRIIGQGDRPDYSQWLDYGWAQLALARPAGAVAAFQAAAAMADSDRRKATCLIYAATAAHLAGDNLTAGQCANAAGLLDPLSKQVAAYRVAYWTMAGDERQKTAANDALHKLGIESAGVEVLDPVSAVVICVVVVGAVVTYINSDADLRSKILPVLLEVLEVGVIVATEVP